MTQTKFLLCQHERELILYRQVTAKSKKSSKKAQKVFSGIFSTKSSFHTSLRQEQCAVRCVGLHSLKGAVFSFFDVPLVNTSSGASQHNPLPEFLKTDEQKEATLKEQEELKSEIVLVLNKGGDSETILRILTSSRSVCRLPAYMNTVSFVNACFCLQERDEWVKRLAQAGVVCLSVFYINFFGI